MTAFLIASAVLVVGILAWVLRPLWRPRPLTGACVVVGLALATALLYGLVGTPRALDPAQLRAPETLAEAIVQLRAELDRDPGQIEGWRLLGRAYAAEGRLVESRDAFARAVALAPDEPGLLAEAAEARAQAHPQHRFDAEAVAMLRHTLEIDPANQRARWFLGIALRQAGEAAEAARTWEPLLAAIDPGTVASVREQINLARAEAGLEPLAAPEPQDEAASPVAITIAISLEPSLAMQYPDGASVFVIARQPDGPPMPVAVRKLQPTGFPLTVTLTDADSLMPTMKLSQLERVELAARVSASGDAIPAPGDFESAPVVVDTAADAAAALTIDRVVE